MDLIGKSLYEISKNNGSTLRMFELLMNYEFQLSKTSETILRANSLTTKTIDALMKDLTPEYLGKMLKKQVQKAVGKDLVIEVDRK